MDGFTLIAEPTRRRILDRLGTGDSDVGSLVGELDLPQPQVSKHLRALRDAGAVTVRRVGRRRVYQLSSEPLPDVLAWVRSYERIWTASLDRLADVLADDDEETS